MADEFVAIESKCPPDCSCLPGICMKSVHDACKDEVKPTEDYKIGWKDGYSQGYSDGLSKSKEDYDKAYNEGYNAAKFWWPENMT